MSALRARGASRRASISLALGLGLTLGVAACKPDLVDSTGTVDTPRLLAVRAEPAEAKAGEPVALTALYGDRTGVLGAGALDWAFCIDRKPLTELGPLSPRCLVPAGTTLVPLGEGVATRGTLPRDGCRLFGPDRPDPKPGEPSGRPVDPDTTGGFYQPIRVRAVEQAGDAYSVFGVRLACGVGGATQEQRAELERTYVRNSNPALRRLARVRDGREEDVAGVLEVRPGETLVLRAGWAPCPDVGTCEGAERYAYFDPTTRAVGARREAIRVAWFATGGTLAEERTGRGEDEVYALDTENRWTAPEVAGESTLFLVIRDDRGGVGWQTYRVRVGL